MPRNLRPRASRLKQRCRGREHCREDRGPREGVAQKRRWSGETPAVSVYLLLEREQDLLLYAITSWNK